MSRSKHKENVNAAIVALRELFVAGRGKPQGDAPTRSILES
jgi:hypothetical protein